jgi:hypothetical protein
VARCRHSRLDAAAALSASPHRPDEIEASDAACGVRDVATSAGSPSPCAGASFPSILGNDA